MHHYERVTPLTFDAFPNGTNESNYIKQLKPGDAVITFSKGGVLGISEQIEKGGLKTSVIYGNLPPSARKYQVEQFATGETEVVVATDVIGMGINLPIKRIVFSAIEKFDDVEKRVLYSQEMYNLITCPLDTDIPVLKRDFVRCCRDYNDGLLEYYLPDLEGDPRQLYAWETFYKRLDLYYQISRKTGKIIREKELKTKRNMAIKEINRILKKRYYFMNEKVGTMHHRRGSK